MSRILKTPKADFEYHDEGLLVITLAEDCELSLDDIREQREIAFSFHQGKPHVVLAIAGQRTSATEEARKYASMNVPEGRLAEAILIRSLPVRLLGNFYLKFHKPNVPTKMFESRENAMIWLRGKLNATGKKSLAKS